MNQSNGINSQDSMSLLVHLASHMLKVLHDDMTDTWSGFKHVE